MKQGYKYLFSVTVGIILLLAACSKGGTTVSDNSGGSPHVDNPGDTTAPVLDIYTPTLNQVFINGTIINITGRITDNAGLYRGSIKLTNDANGAVLKEQAYEIHGIVSYNFNISYTTSVTTVSDYTITATFEDHGSNSTTKSVKVKVNP